MRPVPQRLRLTYLFGAILAAALSLTGLAASSARQDLTYNLPAEPMTLDPIYASDLPSYTVALNMFEGLVRLDQTNRPVPGMAESWRISTDGLVYRFTLRQARWNNGQSVTASDFVFAWLQALKPGLAAERASMLFVVANAEAYHKGALLDPREVGVKAVDPRTLEVRLAKPAGHFLALCSLPPFLPVNRKTAEANPQSWSLDAKTSVSNGPFRLAGYKPHGHITLTPNPFYWQQVQGRAQSVTLTWLNTEQATAAYNAGLLEGLVGPKQGLKGQYMVRPEPRLTYLQFNLRKPPFDQLLLRNVAGAAMNRSVLSEEIPAFAAVAPGLPDATSGKDFRAVGGGMLIADRDLNTARRLLGVAGHPNGAGLPEISLLYVDNIKNYAFVNAVVASLAEVGLKVTPAALNWADFQRRLASGQFDLARMGWSADYPDPNSFLALFAGDAPTNFGGYRSADYDQALRTASAATDPLQRMAALHRAEAILFDDLPIVPITFGKQIYLSQPYLRDLAFTFCGVPLFQRAWVDAH